MLTVWIRINFCKVVLPPTRPMTANTRHIHVLFIKVSTGNKENVQRMEGDLQVNQFDVQICEEAVDQHASGGQSLGRKNGLY